MAEEGEDVFGSGIKLTRNWDLEIDNTGDIMTTSGVDEFEKDVAFISTDTLHDYVGKPVGILTEKEIEQALIRALRDDERIDTIIELNVYRLSDPDQIEVDGRIESDHQTYDLVFEV